MTRFEYKVLRIAGVRPETFEPKLNVLGAEGYEFKFANEWIMVLSRPVSEPSSKPKSKPEQALRAGPAIAT